MSDTPKKRLIEVAFPLREVSDESSREKNIRHGHVSTLHIWWARKPLAVSRATALAALLNDDPPSRLDVLQLIKDFCRWENSLNTHLSRKAQALVKKEFKNRAPRMLDCFAGGGAIPLEALRLGCETYALDYNPVAVLISKAILEFPEKYGKAKKATLAVNGSLGMKAERYANPLLEEVTRWANWVLTEAKKELSTFYPSTRDSQIPVGYYWMHSVPCQNPACGADIPLTANWWLAKSDRKKVAIRARGVKKRVVLEIVEGKAIDFDPDEGSISRAHVRCPACGSTIDDTTTRKIFQEGRAGERLAAVISNRSDQSGKTYRVPSDADLQAFRDAQNHLRTKQECLSQAWGISSVPDEPLRRVPVTFGVINLWVYGMNTWGDLFNDRQKLTLITFAEKVRGVYEQMTKDGANVDFARAVVTYLSIMFNRLIDKNARLVVYNSIAEKIEHVYGRPALPMIWDYVELNPFTDVGWPNMQAWVEEVISHCSQIEAISPATVLQGSAANLPWVDDYFDVILTDPPYYDNVPYSYISDFFYVWLRRTVGELYPELFATPLSPKSEDMVAYVTDSNDPDSAKRRFELMFTKALREIRRVLKPEGVAVVVFAYAKTEAWEAVINAVLNAGLYLTASWPIHTERKARQRAQESAALGSSIYMVCRKRTANEIGEFPAVRAQIDGRVRERLEEFWKLGIRGADFFMSAIGPAVEVFGRYERVEKLSGEVVEVRDLLDYVEKVVSEFALERILGSAELGGVDPETRFYLLWRWTYSQARVPFDEGNKLAQAVGTELKTLWDKGGIVSKEKDFVRVMGPKDREKDKKFLNQVGFTTMVDAMHRACVYWEHGERRQLKEHLAQTYGANNIFWRVVQNIADVLPEGDTEKQMLQGLLNVPEARDKVAASTGKLFAE